MNQKDETFRISMRDFINGPYIKCPKCGKMSFGILGIYDHQYSRRCRDCYYPHPSKNESSVVVQLPSLNKKVIYLDQLCISEITKFLNPLTKAHQAGKVDHFWGVLFGKLDELVKLQLIVCPDSDFHKHESLLAPFYDGLKRIYEHLSGGVSFYDYETIQRFQILRQLRKWLKEEDIRELNVHTITEGNINAWQDRIYFSMQGYQSQDLIDEIRSNREKVADGIEKIFNRWQMEKNKDFSYWYSEERDAHARLLASQHVQYMKNFLSAAFGLIPFHVGHFLHDMASTLFFEIKECLQKSGIIEDQLSEKLQEFLLSEDFKNAPHIVISSMLHAAMARRAALGRKRFPTRGYMTDVHIISTLLPYCDAMFIDNESRSLLCEEPLNVEVARYKTRLFSISNRDECLHFLDEIKFQASEDHCRAIREVYGDDWPKPYWEIFQGKT